MGNDWIVCALFALADYVAQFGDREVSVPHYGTFKASDIHAQAEADREAALDAVIAAPLAAPSAHVYGDGCTTGYCAACGTWHCMSHLVPGGSLSDLADCPKRAAPRDEGTRDDEDDEKERCERCSGAGYIAGRDTDPQGGEGPFGHPCPDCRAPEPESAPRDSEVKP